YSNLGSFLHQLGDLPSAEEAALEAYRITERLAHVPGMRFTSGNMMELELMTGRWEAVEPRVNEFLNESGTGTHYMDGGALFARALIELARPERALPRSGRPR